MKAGDEPQRTSLLFSPLETFDRATVIFAISGFSSRFVTFLSFCSKIAILSTPNLVQSSYGRNRFGGVIWRRDDAAHAMGKLTNDNDYWYDGLYQVQQHDRGTLNAYLTGITSPVQSENFTFDEMGNWLAYDTQTPSLSQSREYNQANEITSVTNPSSVVQPNDGSTRAHVLGVKPQVFT